MDIVRVDGYQVKVSPESTPENIPRGPTLCSARFIRELVAAHVSTRASRCSKSSRMAVLSSKGSHAVIDGKVASQRERASARTLSFLRGRGQSIFATFAANAIALCMSLNACSWGFGSSRSVRNRARTRAKPSIALLSAVKNPTHSQIRNVRYARSTESCSSGVSWRAAECAIILSSNSRRVAARRCRSAGLHLRRREYRGMRVDDYLTGKEQHEAPANSWPGVLRGWRNGTVVVAAAAVVVSNAFGEPSDATVPVNLLGPPINAHSFHGPESPNRPLYWERVEVQMISAGPPRVEWRLARRSRLIT
jgi:hypothetical protein